MLQKQPNAAKMEPNAAQPVPRGKVPIPGMSNQEMLAFLSASPKQRVSQEDGIRQKLTEKFGVDFSGLKITRNAALADIHERAYTKGNEIHLAPDVNPVSMEGQEILTHEAVHVIQQGTRSLSGGMLHDSLMEAQANDIARGAGHIDVSGFSMPTADNAPVQGFLGFIFNRFRSNANKKNMENEKEMLMQQARELRERNDQDTAGYYDLKFNREMGKLLAKYGLGGTAVLDPVKHPELFKKEAGTEDGGFHTTIKGNKQIVYASQLSRELESLPREKHARKTGALKLYGISQKELDGLFRLKTDAYRSFIERTVHGANAAANMDWTNMSDSEFIKNFPLLRALSRLNVAANQGSARVGADEKLAKDPKNKALIGGLDDTSVLLGELMSYGPIRLEKNCWCFRRGDCP